MGLLDAKTVLITGAGNGIGRECALAAAAQGSQILVNDIGRSMVGEGACDGPVRDAIAEIRAAGGQAVANVEPVADLAATARMVEQACDVFGGQNAIIHSAGIVRRSAAKDMRTIFVASKAGDYVVGSTLPAEGGFASARLPVSH